MTLENTNLVFGIIIFVMVLILFYRQSRPVTLGGIVESYEEGVPLANELATISRTAVGSAEHLGLIGDLVSNEDKLEYAINYVKTWFPGGSIDDLDDDTILGAINSAVHDVNYLTAQIKLAKKALEDRPIPTQYPA